MTTNPNDNDPSGVEFPTSGGDGKTDQFRELVADLMARYLQENPEITDDMEKIIVGGAFEAGLVQGMLITTQGLEVMGADRFAKGEMEQAVSLITASAALKNTMGDIAGPEPLKDIIQRLTNEDENE